jgi:DNA helicase II / ATP-dependent DNA helicase PcrA
MAGRTHIDYAAELNADQYAAVTAPAGPSLVLAGAGSGKTRTLTYRVAYLLLEQRVHPDNLLLLTFTNKAAREMIDRVLALTGIQYPPRWGGTFHSVAGRLLRIHGHHLGLKPHYTILDQDDAEGLLSRVIKEHDKLYLKNKDNPKASVIAGIISYARNTCQSIEEVARERYPWEKRVPGQIVAFNKLYQVAKLEQQVVDYDDILVFWLRLLEEFPAVRDECNRRFPWILVDEYQDTNTLQSRIVDWVGSHHNIMAVGDDAQCIYTWRGANFANIHDFPERHPGTRLYKILVNYRSTPQILSLANAVLAAQPPDSGYAKELRADRPSSVLPRLVAVFDSRAQAQFLIRRIESLYHEGYALNDIAVLYRAHFQALDLQLELSRSGIPFAITSGVRFFEQAHVRDFIAQIRAVVNPADISALDRLFGLLPRVGPATIRKIFLAANKARDKAEKQRADAAQGSLFSAVSPALPTLPADIDIPLVAILGDPAVLAAVPVEAREDFEALAATLVQLWLSTLPDASGRNTRTPAQVIEQALDGWYGDFIHNVYTDWQSRRDDLLGLVNFAERFDTLPELLAQLVLLNSEASNRSIDPDDQSVRLSTVHQAKGLEFRVVFVISCADELFPLKRTIETGDIEEERRLFYVAVTRARDELYLVCPQMGYNHGSVTYYLPSRFIQEVPADRYEKAGYAGR